MSKCLYMNGIPEDSDKTFIINTLILKGVIPQSVELIEEKCDDPNEKCQVTDSVTSGLVAKIVFDSDDEKSFGIVREMGVVNIKTNRFVVLVENISIEDGIDEKDILQSLKRLNIVPVGVELNEGERNCAIFLKNINDRINLIVENTIRIKSKDYNIKDVNSMQYSKDKEVEISEKRKKMEKKENIDNNNEVNVNKERERVGLNVKGVKGDDSLEFFEILFGLKLKVNEEKEKQEEEKEGIIFWVKEEENEKKVEKVLDLLMNIMRGKVMFKGEIYDVEIEKNKIKNIEKKEVEEEEEEEENFLELEVTQEETVEEENIINPFGKENDVDEDEIDKMIADELSQSIKLQTSEMEKFRNKSKERKKSIVEEELNRYEKEIRERNQIFQKESYTFDEKIKNENSGKEEEEEEDILLLDGDFEDEQINSIKNNQNQNKKSVENEENDVESKIEKYSKLSDNLLLKNEEKEKNEKSEAKNKNNEKKNENKIIHSKERGKEKKDDFSKKNFNFLFEDEVDEGSKKETNNNNNNIDLMSFFNNFKDETSKKKKIAANNNNATTSPKKKEEKKNKPKQQILFMGDNDDDDDDFFNSLKHRKKANSFEIGSYTTLDYEENFVEVERKSNDEKEKVIENDNNININTNNTMNTTTTMASNTLVKMDESEDDDIQEGGVLFPKKKKKKSGEKEKRSKKKMSDKQPPIFHSQNKFNFRNFSVDIDKKDEKSRNLFFGGKKKKIVQ